MPGDLKTLLKEMALPVVPSRAYGPLTDAASDAGRIAQVLCGLPELNRLVIASVVRILAKVRATPPSDRDSARAIAAVRGAADRPRRRRAARRCAGRSTGTRR